jgi:PAS domain S-box-containing protein
MKNLTQTLHRVMVDLKPYVFAFSFMACAIVLRVLLNPILGEGEYPFVTLCGAVVFCSRYCGIGASVVATLGGIVYIWHEFLPPVHSFTLANIRTEAAGLTLFGVVAGLIIALGERTRRAESTHYLLAAIVDSSDDAIVSKTLEGIITSWNKGAERLFGYSVAEAVGQPVTFIIPPDRIAEESDILSRLGRGERIDHFETVRKRKDGSLVEDSLIISPVKDFFGQIVGASKVARDITIQKQAERALRESEQRYRTVTDAAPLLVWMAGTDKLCYYFNKGWLDFVGRTLEQEAGNGWSENVHPEDFDRCLQIYVSNFDARRPFEMEYRLRHHSGQYRWIFDRGVPRYASDGSFEGYVGGCLDIHDR